LVGDEPKHGPTASDLDVVRMGADGKDAETVRAAIGE